MVLPVCYLCRGRRDVQVFERALANKTAVVKKDTEVEYFSITCMWLQKIIIHNKTKEKSEALESNGLLLLGFIPDSIS